jgi:hypothetical protein
MTLLPRQKLGLALFLISLLSAVIIQLATGDLVHIRSTVEPAVRGALPSEQMTIHLLAFSWGYIALIAACAALGLCLLVPQRRMKPR